MVAEGGGGTSSGALGHPPGLKAARPPLRMFHVEHSCGLPPGGSGGTPQHCSAVAN